MQQNFDMQQLKKMVGSSAGKQLLEVLKQQGGSELDQAAALASSGNLQEARKALSGLLRTPEVQKLLKQLEGQL